jgi:two-component system, NarL family, response regulator NreC
MSITIVVADDHGLIRAGLRALLSGEPDMRVIGEAPDGCEALKLVEQLQPDLLLADICMPGPSGIEIAAELARRGCATRVLVVSVYEDATLVARALAAGARGYLAKRGIEAELLSAVRTVNSGGTYIHSEVRGIAPAEAARALVTPDLLSEDELTLVCLVAHGYSQQQIARELHMSAAALEGRRSELTQKLGLISRVDLVRYAREYRLM